MIKRIIDNAVNRSRFEKNVVKVIIDFALASLSLFISLSLRLNALDYTEIESSLRLFVIAVGSALFFLAASGVYGSFTRYTSFHNLRNIALCSFASSLSVSVFIDTSVVENPWSIPITYGITLFTTLSVFRLGIKQTYSSTLNQDAEPVAIYGAGEAGRHLVTALQQSAKYHPSLFIDDNAKLQNLRVGDLKIFDFDSAMKVAKKRGVNTIIISIPSATFEQERLIIERIEPYCFKTKKLPSIRALIEGRAHVDQLRQLKMDELLGRQKVKPEKALISKNTIGKVMLVSGAGGSIGQVLCEKLLLEKPSAMVLFDNNEYNLYSLDLKLTEKIAKTKSKTKIIPVLGSVRDQSKIEEILQNYRVETIFHAAAYKHVPLTEVNVAESVANNIFGTSSLLTAATKFGVSNFTLVSTDKAVRPTNVMGATKRIAELVCQGFADSSSKTTISIVRFGNVIGSSGSVIPLFLSQIKNGGPMTVTHPEVERYFMSTNEAAELVIQAASMAKGGEVFVLDMGDPVNILALAKKMARLSGLKPYLKNVEEEPVEGKSIPIEIVGLKKGEKLYEEVLISGKPTPTSHQQIFSAQETKLSKEDVDEVLHDLKTMKDAEEIIQYLSELPIGFTHAKI